MIASLLVLSVLSLPAFADTLPVELGDKTGTITTPSGSEVNIGLAPVGEGDSQTWKNEESSALSFVCGDEGKMADDSFVDQVLLQVGDKKWALAPGSSVKFSCGDKPASVMDIHGNAIGTFPKGVKVTIVGVRSSGGR